MSLNLLLEIRCKETLPDGRVCNRFLGKIGGDYEIKCPRCKTMVTNRKYNKVTGE